MQWSNKLRFLAGICVIGACVRPAAAGGPFPCVKAVSSPQGNFLVITDRQIEPIQGDIGEIRQVSFQMFPKEEFINAKDRMNSPLTSWTDWKRWSVVLDARVAANRPFAWSCSLPLITDDGEFLVLLSGSALYTDAALRIYRRRDHFGDPVREGPDQGVLVRDIPLKEIWPPDKMAATSSWNDTTPQWFAGGTFEFDSHQLVHKTRWGNTIRINLPDGSVSAK
jgi:hypothetical protein